MSIKTVINVYHIYIWPFWTAWGAGVCLPLLACASGEPQRWEPEPGSSPRQDGTDCKPSGRRRGPAACGRGRRVPTFVLSSLTLRASGRRRSPVTSSCRKHFVEGKLPMEVPLNDVHPGWISLLAQQLLKRGFLELIGHV